MKEKAFIHRLLTAAVALLVMSCSSEEAQVQGETKGIIIRNGKKTLR